MSTDSSPIADDRNGIPLAGLSRLKSSLQEVPTKQLVAAIMTGFLGSIPLGLMMQYGNPEPLIALALPSMYGLAGPDIALGWALHQFHGIALALMFVVAVQWPPIQGSAKTLRGSLGLAVLAGVGTTALLSVLLMPLWLQAVGYPYAPTFPDLTIPEKFWSVGGHIVYALPVTVGYALLAGE